MSLLEYKVVKNNTADLERLQRLWEWQLNQTQAALLATELLMIFGLPPIELSFTGRSDRGSYVWSTGRLVVRKDNIRAEVLVHELAHHWVHTKMGGKSGEVHRPLHGADFTSRLDQLARVAEDLMLRWEYP